MSSNPINLFVRLLIEVASLIVFGYWGYNLSDSSIRIIPAILLPLLFASLWGVFAVKDDPSRSGKTVVPTPGPIRLFIELGLFAAATWMLFDLDYQMAGWIFAGITAVHYLLSYDRVIWLLKLK